MDKLFALETTDTNVRRKSGNEASGPDLPIDFYRLQDTIDPLIESCRL